MDPELPLATHAAELVPGADKGAPEWVHLMPFGTWSGGDGRGPYSLAAGQAPAVIAASKRAGGQLLLPIDYDHQLEQPIPVAGAPAAGWIVDLAARADGVWGRVEWTARAAQMIGAREYRFLSPVFRHTKAGEVVRLERAGLTNKPNFDLTALASRQAQPEVRDTMTFDELLKKLRAALGLGDDADADKAVAHAADLAKKQKASGDTMTAIAAAVGAKPDADLAAAVKAAVEKPDPAKFVSIEDYNKLSQSVAAIQTDRAKEKAAAAVEQAIKDGKLIPAQKDWALAFAARDPADFDKFIAAQPKLVDFDERAAGGGGSAGAGDAVSIAAKAQDLQAEELKKGRQISTAEAVRRVSKGA